jgi:hypothetical protein
MIKVDVDIRVGMIRADALGDSDVAADIAPAFQLETVDPVCVVHAVRLTCDGFLLIGADHCSHPYGLGESPEELVAGHIEGLPERIEHGHLDGAAGGIVTNDVA